MSITMSLPGKGSVKYILLFVARERLGKCTPAAMNAGTLENSFVSDACPFLSIPLSLPVT
jgi:hypothetical protein